MDGWSVLAFRHKQLELAQKQAREWRPKTAAASEGARPAHT